jgi:hypothetical protein
MMYGVAENVTPLSWKRIPTKLRLCAALHVFKAHRGNADLRANVMSQASVTLMMTSMVLLVILSGAFWILLEIIRTILRGILKMRIHQKTRIPIPSQRTKTTLPSETSNQLDESEPQSSTL